MKNRCPACIAAAAFFAAVCVAPAAHAFTMQDSGAPAGGQGYLKSDNPTAPPDRMAPVNRFGSENGQTTFNSGNSTFQFGQRPSFEQRYNTENMFNPYTREGR